MLSVIAIAASAWLIAGFFLVAAKRWKLWVGLIGAYAAVGVIAFVVLGDAALRSDAGNGDPLGFVFLFLGLSLVFAFGLLGGFIGWVLHWWQEHRALKYGKLD